MKHSIATVFIASAVLTIAAASTVDDLEGLQVPVASVAPVLLPPSVDADPQGSRLRPVARVVPVAVEAAEQAKAQQAQIYLQQHQVEGCALSGQVKLCVNHAAMQRATCASDDLDCQCTWAGVTTTCFSPCISDKESMDGMHVARGEQETICSQAAKFGKIAKDKERQKQEEKMNKGKKKKEMRTSAPKNIDDMNNSAGLDDDFNAPKQDNKEKGDQDGADSGRRIADKNGSGGSSGRNGSSGRGLKSGDKTASVVDVGAAPAKFSSAFALVSLGATAAGLVALF
ncbi:hypothetical protein GGI07_003154 [Coemansia sp. Benny D115]|nr:hypothetical protein GGI07_003154 [Coemansia sp. Benny D115]